MTDSRQEPPRLGEVSLSPAVKALIRASRDMSNLYITPMFVGCGRMHDLQIWISFLDAVARCKEVDV